MFAVTFVTDTGKVVHKDKCYVVPYKYGNLCDFSGTIYSVQEVNIDCIEYTATVTLKKHHNHLM